MSRLLRTAAHAHVASSVIGRNQRRQAQKWSQQDRAAAAAVAQAPAAPPPAVAPAGGDMDAKIAQLKQLGELRDSGILTDAEFEAKKAQILA